MGNPDYRVFFENSLGKCGKRAIRGFTLFISGIITK
jgi:hypothetical protein